MEEKNKNEYLISTLPIKKESYVIAKYASVMLIVMVNLAISLLMNYIISLGIGLNNPVGHEPMLIVLVCIAVPIILSSIGIPIIMKMGVAKGQIIVILSVAAIMAVVGASGSLLNDSILQITKSTFIILAIGICVVLMLSSYFISLNIYNKKEIL